MNPRPRSRLSHVLRTVFLPSIMLALLLAVGQDVLGAADRLTPQLVVPIPNLNLDEIVRSTVPASATQSMNILDIPWISNYVAGVYRYAVSIAGILAGVMFIVGGFQYMTAGGDASRVSAGKERITDALIGLFLTLSAFVILLTINPDLVSLRSLRIISVERKSFNLIPPSQVQAITGSPVPPAGSGGGPAGTGGTAAGGSGMMGMAMTAARATGIPELPCFVQGSMRFESGGNPNAIGHDEEAASTVFSVGARRTFINSGVLYSQKTFPAVGCQTMACQNQGPRCNDDAGGTLCGHTALGAAPDFGIDWRFSHGFGAGQSTIFPSSAPCSGGGGRGFRMGGHCYGVAQLLDAPTQVQAMVDHYKACWQRGGGDAARAYVCYAGTIAPDNPIIVQRVNAFNACRAAGG